MTQQYPLANIDQVIGFLYDTEMTDLGLSGSNEPNSAPGIDICVNSIDGIIIKPGETAYSLKVGRQTEIPEDPSVPENHIGYSLLIKRRRTADDPSESATIFANLKSGSLYGSDNSNATEDPGIDSFVTGVFESYNFSRARQQAKQQYRFSTLSELKSFLDGAEKIAVEENTSDACNETEYKTIGFDLNINRGGNVEVYCLEATVHKLNGDNGLIKGSDITMYDHDYEVVADFAIGTLYEGDLGVIKDPGTEDLVKKLMDAYPTWPKE